MKKKRFPWTFIILLTVIIFFFLVISGCVALLAGVEAENLPGNVAVIPIKGIILSEKSDFTFEKETTSPETIKLIDKANKNDKIKAIVFEINSPGGSAVASDEIAQEIKKSKKPTVAFVREVGASGAYWVASATNYIIANRMSITGSIGVIAGYLEFSGFLTRYNITYQRLVSGKYKDIGTPFKQLTVDEKELFQQKLDTIYSYFVEEIASNRRLSKEQVKELATGIFYLGVEAKNLGLVDELGGEEELKIYLNKTIGVEPEYVKYKPKTTFFNMLTEALSKPSFFVGQGIGSIIFSKNRIFDRFEIFT